MKRTLERELKLEPGPGFVLPELPGEPLESRVFTSTYYDTPPRSLLRAGITLRRRLENGVSRWQLKLPRDAPARAELEELGGPAGPPDALRSLLVAHLRHGPLEEVATMRTRRTGVRFAEAGHGVAEVTLDAVAVLDGGRSAGEFAELEIELVEGDDDDLDRLARVLRRAGAKRTDGTPKLMRVLGSDTEEAATSTDRLRGLFRAQLVAIERADPGVRLGDDPEDVHRMRVATRRARALIHATEPLLESPALPAVAPELKWLAVLLGDVRDLDVLLEDIHGAVARLDADRAGGEALAAQLEDERAAARERLLEGLDAHRYIALLDAYGAAIETPPELAAPLADVAAEQLKKLRKKVDALPDDPADDELHALRKKAKRARYAAELAALESDGLGRYVDALKDVQDVIGEHQDAVVAEQRLRKLARAGTALAAGRLIAHERARRARARATYLDVVGTAVRRGRKAL